jgi:hypothetical protein
MYLPSKYFRTLSKTKRKSRKREISRFGSMSSKDPRAYTGFKTDKNMKTRKSSYSARWERKFPGVKSLEARSKATGVPLSIIKESYNRGMAAWRTGHRPGATQQQWAYARVSSLLLKGKTAKTADADLVKKAKNRSAKARKWFEKRT